MKVKVYLENGTSQTVMSEDFVSAVKWVSEMLPNQKIVKAESI